MAMSAEEHVAWIYRKHTTDELKRRLATAEAIKGDLGAGAESVKANLRSEIARREREGVASSISDPVLRGTLHFDSEKPEGNYFEPDTLGEKIHADIVNWAGEKVESENPLKGRTIAIETIRGHEQEAIARVQAAVNANPRTFKEPGVYRENEDGTWEKAEPKPFEKFEQKPKWELDLRSYFIGMVVSGVLLALIALVR